MSKVYTQDGKRRVVSKESYVLDIKKHRGEQKIVKMWAALIFGMHIKRKRQVPLN